MNILSDRIMQNKLYSVTVSHFRIIFNYWNSLLVDLQYFWL